MKSALLAFIIISTVMAAFCIVFSFVETFIDVMRENDDEEKEGE